MAAIQIPGAQRGVPLPVVGPVNWWIVAGLLVFGASAMLPVFQNSMATSRGFDTQKLQLQQTQLRSDIKLLEVDVANLTSLDRIEARARALGLGPGENPLSVTVSVAGPAPAKLPSSYIAEPIHLDVPSPKPWWRSLLP